ncbi:uncharacterized protein JCM10292_001234 [Rhodotorula paludigena]|uniref:uncharacterized protein n=1 Tax=Rhodotorula paludigena TaxID=86838 RepID=UPI00317D5DA4
MKRAWRSSRLMSLPKETEATHTGQVGPLGPHQPAQAHPTPPAGGKNAQPAPSTGHVYNAWDKATAQEKDVMLKSIQAYLEDAKFEDGAGAGSRARLVHLAVGAEQVPLALLSSAGRAMQSTINEIPPNTIRAAIPMRSTQAGSERNTLVSHAKAALMQHYSGNCLLPYIAELAGNSEAPYAPLMSGVAGVRFVRFAATRGAYEMDVGFRDAAALAEAVKVPFLYQGRPIQLDYAPVGDLCNVVEVRLVVPHLYLQDAIVVKALASAFDKAEGAALHSVYKLYDSTTAKFGHPVPVFTGAFRAYVRFPSLVRDAAGTFKSRAEALIPHKVRIAGAEVALRHNYELVFCPRCQTPGHDKTVCPKFPCSSCNRAGHIASACSDPTGRAAVGAKAAPPAPFVFSASRDQGWQVAGRRGIARTGSNAEPLGARNSFAALEVEDTEEDTSDVEIAAALSGSTKAQHRAAAKAKRAAAASVQGSVTHKDKRPKGDQINFAPVIDMANAPMSEPAPPAQALPGKHLVAGDLNDCPDPALDRPHQAVSNGHHWALFLSRLPQHYDDVVRLRYPRKALYTRPHKHLGRIISSSRIDHILANTRLSPLLKAAHIRYDAPFSDHRPVEAVFELSEVTHVAHELPRTSECTPRFNPLLLNNTLLNLELTAFISSGLQSQPECLSPKDRWEHLKKGIACFLASRARDRSRRRRQQQYLAELELQQLEAAGAVSPNDFPRWQHATNTLRNLTFEQRQTASLRAHIPIMGGVPAELAALEQRHRSRLEATTFRSVRLTDGSHTVDIARALAAADEHFQEIFSLKAQPAVDVSRARAALLQHIRASSPSSDPRLGRRWASSAAAHLDLPITADEVRLAISSAPSSSSPGPDGLPYEFYKSQSNVLAPALAALYNDVWLSGSLAPSQSVAHVRLLLKRKPGVDKAALTSYRPISLRSADYRLLARILVKRINVLLPLAIPPSQVGFVPGRRSAEAARHLQLLLEEIGARPEDFPRAALLSLDMEKAYNRVDHAWVFEAYEAFGAPPRFCALLRVLYDESHLRARYNINGFLSPGIQLRTGLPQGDPLSCATWLISFQPFLDALVLRQVALQLYAPLSSVRADVVTSVAFADDALVVVEELQTALPRLNSLADDWSLATNGRLNTSKTEGVRLGPACAADPFAPLVAWRTEGFATWAGFPISSTPPDAFYHALLARIRRRIGLAQKAFSSPRTRALYSNAHILALSLHLLSFWPAPSWFIDKLTSALLNYVWGGSGGHAVAKATLFLAPRRGGLGLLSPADFDTANSLRFLDEYIGGDDVLWRDLATSSFRRAFPSSAASPAVLVTSPLALLRPGTRAPGASRSAGSLWTAVAAAASAHPPLPLLSRLSSAALLALPPSLFCPAPILRPVKALAHLYWQYHPGASRPAGLYSLPLPLPSPHSVSGLRAARHVWLAHTLLHPALFALLPSSAAVVSLPLPSQPPRGSLSFLGLPPSFSAAAARRALVALRSTAPISTRLASLLPPSLPSTAVEKAWQWVALPPATALEAHTHWLILHGALRTRRRLHKQQLAAGDACLFCGASDTLAHAIFDCQYSRNFWIALTTLLATAVSPAFTATTMASDEILLGLPTLHALAPREAHPAFRAVVAVALQSLVDARWARIRPLNPTSSSPSSAELADRALLAVADRLS